MKTPEDQETASVLKRFKDDAEAGRTLVGRGMSAIFLG